MLSVGAILNVRISGMRKMVIVERCKFAQLLRSYKKSLYLNRVLEHICRQYRSYVTLTADEVCELIELDRDTVIRKTLHGRLRADTVNGVRYYDIMDLINLKDSIESQYIFRQTMDCAVPDTSIRIVDR